jgi:hypothetical protein
VLTPADLEAFARDGFVPVREAFPVALALELQAEIWQELEEDHGIRRDDPTTWRTPPHSPRRAKASPRNEALGKTRLAGAIGELLNDEDWPRPASWGGFLITMPHPERARTRWQLPTETWHWDGAPDGRGLVVFSFYGEVEPRGGGTLVVRGSHRLVKRTYAGLAPEDLALPHASHRKAVYSLDPWLAALSGRSRAPSDDRTGDFMERDTEVQGLPLRVVELTGRPGDAVLCDVHLLHCQSPNHLETPRFMRSKFLFLE